MRARWTAGLAVLAAAAAVLPAGAAEPEAQSDQAQLALTSVTSGATGVTVRGTLELPAAAFAPVALSTDAAGDTSVPGTDLRGTTAALTGWPATPAVTLKLGLQAGGTPALHGFSVPIDTGDGRNLWLGAGTPGSNSGRTANWTGLCVITTGYSCATDVPGGIAADGVTWQLALDGPTGLRSGSTLAPGAAYGGVPTSFAWPVGLVTAGVAPHDSAGGLSGYVVPGGVEAAVVPTSDGEPVEWTATTKVKPTTGTFTVTVPRSTGSVPQTLWVRSCFGSADEPTCTVLSRAL